LLRILLRISLILIDRSGHFWCCGKAGLIFFENFFVVRQSIFSFENFFEWSGKLISSFEILFDDLLTRPDCLSLLAHSDFLRDWFRIYWVRTSPSSKCLKKPCLAWFEM